MEKKYKYALTGIFISIIIIIVIIIVFSYNKKQSTIPNKRIEIPHIKNEIKWGKWSNWSECLGPCENGYQIRSRICSGTGCDKNIYEEKKACQYECINYDFKKIQDVKWISTKGNMIIPNNHVIIFTFKDNKIGINIYRKGGRKPIKKYNDSYFETKENRLSFYIDNQKINIYKTKNYLVIRTYEKDGFTDAILKFYKKYPRWGNWNDWSLCMGPCNNKGTMKRIKKCLNNYCKDIVERRECKVEKCENILLDEIINKKWNLPISTTFTYKNNYMIIERYLNDKIKIKIYIPNIPPDNMNPLIYIGGLNITPYKISIKNITLIHPWGSKYNKVQNFNIIIYKSYNTKLYKLRTVSKGDDNILLHETYMQLRE